MSTRSAPHHSGCVRRLLLVGAATIASCAGGHTIPLVQTSGAPLTATPPDETPLEVVTRSTAVQDPLPVHGSTASYSELENALGVAISSATVPWAASVKGKRRGGWQLFAEIVQAYAEYNDGRLMVILSVRATMRTRVGNTYVAQVASRCHEAAIVPPERGAPVVYTCMNRIGRDLSGWLGGLEL